MLTVQPKKRIVTRILTAPTGELVRAYFLVAEIEGQTFWKLVKVERLNERTENRGLRTGKILALPCGKIKQHIQLTTYNLQSIRSPYVDQTKNFFISQMTRAPAEALSV